MPPEGYGRVSSVVFFLTAEDAKNAENFIRFFLSIPSGACVRMTVRQVPMCAFKVEP